MIAGLPEYLRRAGYLAGTRVLSASLRPVDDTFASHLELDLGAPDLRPSSVRLAERGADIARARHAPADDFPGLLDQSLSGIVDGRVEGAL